MSAQEYTNEELAVLIKGGRDDLIETLWEKTEKFISMKARHYFDAYAMHSDAVRFELEDLQQQGYIALVEAIEWFDPDAGCSFLTALALRLKSAFAIVSGGRSKRERSDPGLHAISGDVPIGDDTETTFLESFSSTGDLTDDVSSVEDDAISSLYMQELHEILENAMGQLPAKQSDILHQYYYDERTFEQIADIFGDSTQNVSSQCRRALDSLYLAKKMNGLAEYVEENTNYYQSVGIRRYNLSFTSSTEMIVLQRERLAENWKKAREIETEKRKSRMMRRITKIMKEKESDNDNERSATSICR